MPRTECLSAEDTLIVARALLAAASDTARAIHATDVVEREMLQARAARRRDNARWYAQYAGVA